MKTLLKEPLLHFVVLGAALFGAYALMSKPVATEQEKIVITRGQIEHLSAGFASIWQRPPTQDELDGLLRDYVRTEIYAREAVSLGLDREDNVIRQRLRQKLEFVSEDLAAVEEPTDNELRQWLEGHAECFRTETSFSFSQIYFNPDRHGADLTSDVSKAMVRLQNEGAKTDPASLGDPFLLKSSFDSVPAGEVAKQFGEKFVARLRDLKPGQWRGPVESGMGLHLVLITERKEGRMPELAEVRDAVRREWRDSQRREASDKFFQVLQERYTIIIEEHELEKAKKVAEVHQ